MALSVSKLAESAGQLSRNPLGIIALFIVLIYGFASLVIGLSTEGLKPEQKEALIWFLVAFPFVVLFVFAWLVSKHHAKLYAPKDYREDKGFLQTLTTEEKEARVKNEILAAAPEVVTGDVEVEASSTGHAKDEVRSQRPVSEPRRSYSEVRHRYQQAENLAINKLEQEFGKPITRDVKFFGQNSTISFDGAIVGSDEITLVEIFFIRRPFIIPYRIEATFYKAVLIGSDIYRGDLSVALFLVFVTDMPEDEVDRLKGLVERLSSEHKFHLETRFFDFSDLKMEMDNVAESSLVDE